MLTYLEFIAIVTAGLIIGLVIYILSLALPDYIYQPYQAWFKLTYFSNFPKNARDYLFLESKKYNLKHLFLTCGGYIVILIFLQTKFITEFSFTEFIVITLFLGLVSLVDIYYKKIYVQINATFFIVNCCIGVHIHGFSATLIGGFVGFCLFFALYIIGIISKSIIEKRRKCKINSEPFSFADLILGISLSILVGWPLSPVFFLIAISLAAILSIYKIGFDLLNSLYKPFSTIAFAPFLNIGALISILLPDTIRYFL